MQPSFDQGSNRRSVPVRRSSFATAPSVWSVLQQEEGVQHPCLHIPGEGSLSDRLEALKNGSSELGKPLDEAFKVRSTPQRLITCYRRTLRTLSCTNITRT